MPDINPNIPLGVQGPMSSIGGFLDVAKGVTGLKAAQVGLESNTKVLEERNNVRALFQDPSKFMGEDGNFDYNKVVGPLMEAAPTTGGQILTQLFQGQREATIAKQSLLQLGDAQRASVGQWLLSQSQDPNSTKESVDAGLGHLTALMPTLKPAVEFFRKSILANAGDQAALKAGLMQAGQSVMGPAQQVEAMTPGGPVMDSGQITFQQNIKPLAGAVGPVAGTLTQKVLPPTTPVFRGSAPGYLGVTASQAPGSGAGIQSGPSLGQAENVAGSVDVVNKDWNATNESARTASQDIGVLQNIKKYAPGAITGVAGDRRAYLAGLAGLLGMDAAQLEKTNTDVLAKNTNMLALAGGDTNLAKLMAESANPNTHMTPQAIQDAANQVIAQRKLALAKQQYLGHFKGDPAQYQQELAAFNAAADPRALQVSEMSDAELSRMKAAMSPAEREDFGRKIRKLQAMGIVK